MLPGRGQHVHHRIDLKQINLSAHEVRYTRLRHVKHACAFRLNPPLNFGMLFQRHHQRRAESHVLRLGRGIFDGIPYTGNPLIAHVLNALTKSGFRLSHAPSKPAIQSTKRVAVLTAERAVVPEILASVPVP